MCAENDFIPNIIWLQTWVSIIVYLIDIFYSMYQLDIVQLKIIFVNLSSKTIKRLFYRQTLKTLKSKMYEKTFYQALLIFMLFFIYMYGFYISSIGKVCFQRAFDVNELVFWPWKLCYGGQHLWISYIRIFRLFSSSTIY